MPRTIILGSRMDLHTGVHLNSLCENPPGGYTYFVSEGDHVFLFRNAARSPHKCFHWGEFVHFGEQVDLVHSARWPVLGSRAWVTDTDALPLQVIVGRHAVSPEWLNSFEGAWSDEFFDNTSRRVRNMLAAYAHPSCKAVLFRSEFTLETAFRWLRTLGCDDAFDAIAAKSRVCYPAQRPCSYECVQSKWKMEPVNVVYCGRDYETKNGPMTLSVLSRVLSGNPNVRFTFIGAIPASERERWSYVLNRIEYYPKLPRQAVREIFSRSHILFHPSQFEGLGTVFLEAAAAGMAVIVAKGKAMAHIEEVYGGGGALLVDRDVVRPEQEEEAFEICLRVLAGDLSRTRRLGEYNYEMATVGKLSLSRRNAALQAICDAALAGNQAEALTLDSLPCARDAVPVRLTEPEIKNDRIAHRKGIGLTSSRVMIPIDPFVSCLTRQAHA